LSGRAGDGDPYWPRPRDRTAVHAGPFCPEDFTPTKVKRDCPEPRPTPEHPPPCLGLRFAPGNFGSLALGAPHCTPRAGLCPGWIPVLPERRWRKHWSPTSALAEPQPRDEASAVHRVVESAARTAEETCPYFARCSRLTLMAWQPRLSRRQPRCPAKAPIPGSMPSHILARNGVSSLAVRIRPTGACA
jgi:hypothetical protein